MDHGESWVISPILGNPMEPPMAACTGAAGLAGAGARAGETASMVGWQQSNASRGKWLDFAGFSTPKW